MAGIVAGDRRGGGGLNQRRKKPDARTALQLDKRRMAALKSGDSRGALKAAKAKLNVQKGIVASKGSAKGTMNPVGLRRGGPISPDRGGQGTRGGRDWQGRPLKKTPSGNDRNPNQGGQGTPRQGSASAKVGRPQVGTEAYRKMVKAKNKAAGRRSF